jgi:NAD+ diphosphatase
MRRSNFFSDTSIDRVSELRKDAAWLAEQRQAGTSIVLPVWQAKNLIDHSSGRNGEAPRPVQLLFEHVEHLLESAPVVLLGVEETDKGKRSIFAVDLSHLDEKQIQKEFGRDGEFTDLRQIGGLLGNRDGSLCAYARGITHWHHETRHCGRCGTETRIEQAGHARRCVDEDCAKETFPRSDPAVIMLVTHEDRALLGRGPKWPSGFYSTLAGFCEPGESLEAAVAREVWEEARIEIDEAIYHSSQPWPFPQSLMLGFLARAREGGEPEVDGEELAEARWFSHDELGSAIERREVRLPPPLSIARQLIDSWLSEA